MPLQFRQRRKWWVAVFDVGRETDPSLGF